MTTQVTQGRSAPPQRVLRGGWRSPSGVTMLVAFCALGGSLLLVGSGLPRLGTSVIGLGGDPYQTLWRFTKLAEAVRQGSLEVKSDPIRNLGPGPWVPLHAVFGEPLAYNIAWMLQAPLTVLAVSALGRVLGLSPLVAGFAGLLAAFAPYRVAQSLGHFGAMQTFWIPATLATAISWLRAPGIWKTALLGAILLGTAWTEHTLFLTTLVALLVTGACFLPDVRGFFRRRASWFHAAALLALVVVGAVLPFRRELSVAWTGTSTFNLGDVQRRRFVPSLRALVSPPPFHALKNTDEPYGTSVESVADHVPSLGVAAVVAGSIALIFLQRKRRRAVLYLAGLTLVGIGLAVLPRLQNGSTAFDHLPLFSAVRTVNRFLALPSFALPLLAALLTTVRPKGLGVLVGTLLVLDIVPRPPFPVQDAVVPAFYKQLRATRAGAVLEIPAATDYVVASRAVYASTVHGRDIVGSIAFERVDDPRPRQALRRVPFVGDILLLREQNLVRPTIFGQDRLALAHAALASEEIAAVVLHGTVLERPVRGFGSPGPLPATTDALAGVRSALRGAGLTEEAGAANMFLYRVPPWPLETTMAFAIAGEGWKGEERLADGTRRLALARDAFFQVRVVGPRKLPLALAFRVPTHARPSDARGDPVPPHSSRLGGTSGDPVADRALLRTIRLTKESGALFTRTINPGENVLLSLGTLSAGQHAYQLHVDAPSLIVENLTLLGAAVNNP